MNARFDERPDLKNNGGEQFGNILDVSLLFHVHTHACVHICVHRFTRYKYKNSKNSTHSLKKYVKL